MHQPNLSPVPKDNQYMLLDDYPAKYGNIDILVPSGLIYDGASIPRFGWQATYTPFHPDVMAPALVHDWLYQNHQLTREMSDQVLYDLLILNGAGRIRSKLIYHAVRFGGASHWNNSEKDIEKLLMLYVICRGNPNFEKYHFPKEVIFGRQKEIEKIRGEKWPEQSR